jgi:hypothetical protein
MTVPPVAAAAKPRRGFLSCEKRPDIVKDRDYTVENRIGKEKEKGGNSGSETCPRLVS